VSLQDPQDLVSRDEPHLGNAVRVTEGDTDLGRGETLTGELDDLVDDVFGGGLEPVGGGAAVGEGGGRWGSYGRAIKRDGKDEDDDEGKEKL
jgi:hypothetical protein